MTILLGKKQCKMYYVFNYWSEHNILVQYFEFPSRLAHFVIAQVHHEGGQGILSFFPDIPISVLQASIELRDTQHQIPGHCPQSG